MQFSSSPKKIALIFLENRNLIKTLVRREVLGRYKGSLFGILWSFFNPIMMLIIYTFFFSVVFASKWSVGSNSKTEFASLLFIGLIVFNLFSECLARSPGLITENINYVKKVVFPLEILPIVSLGSALFHMIISCGVWLISYFVFFGIPYPTIFLMPIIILPLIFFILGITWIFASLGVYVRDIGQMIGVIIPALMFLSPIFYPINSLPENYQIFVKFNPLALVIEQSREVLFWGKTPDFAEYFIYLAASLSIAMLGFFWFQKTRKGFADVL